jgi:hypothetical protein
MNTHSRTSLKIVTPPFDVAMKALLVVAALLASALVPASAQNVHSKRFLGMSESARNELWARFLTVSGEKCDAVVRTMYQGTAVGTDEWSVGCRLQEQDRLLNLALRQRQRLVEDTEMH